MGSNNEDLAPPHPPTKVVSAEVGGDAKIASPFSGNKVRFTPTQNIHRHQVENLDFHPHLVVKRRHTYPASLAGGVKGSKHKQNIYLRLHNNTKKSRIELEITHDTKNQKILGAVKKGN